MEVIKIKKGETFIERRKRVKEWYIVQEGSARMKYGFISVSLGENAIVGILERDWFLCDYVAETDLTLIVFPYRGVEDLSTFLSTNSKIRRMFIRSAIMQRHGILGVYSQLHQQIRKVHSFVDTTSNEFPLWCQSLGVEASLDLREGDPLEMKHQVDDWELEYSNSLIQIYLDEYLNLMERDAKMSVAAIMEISAQMHRALEGIGEMVSHLIYNSGQLFATDGRDLFHQLLALEKCAKRKGVDPSIVSDRLDQLFYLAKTLRFLDKTLIDSCKAEREAVEAAAVEEPEQTADVVAPVANASNADGDLEAILEFAGYEEAQLREYKELFLSFFKALEGEDDRSEELYQLRKKVNSVFYEIYADCFFKSIEAGPGAAIPAPVTLLLYFGYMGCEPLEAEQVSQLYELIAHLELCRSANVFPMYDWLRMIFEGEREPSRNEFDLDYRGYLQDMVKSGQITRPTMESFKDDQAHKVDFEVHNMFKSANRMCNGRVLQFHPVLTKKDLAKDLRRMLLTAERLTTALDGIRQVDFSAFYRTLSHHELGDDLKHESMLHEILPDIILMPGVGERAAMWQETGKV